MAILTNRRRGRYAKYRALARRARPAGGALAAGDAELAAGDVELAAGDAELAAGDAELAAGDAARESMSIRKAAGSARAWGVLGALGVARAASAAEGATRERHCGQEGSCCNQREMHCSWKT